MGSATKYVYDFAEGNRDLKDLLGGKGANLAEMTKLGLPVPPGFVITTEACREYLNQGSSTRRACRLRSASTSPALEKAMGKALGDADDPLLVSVRSGAKFSMPGMMDTVLNIGLNDESVQGLAKQADNARFAWDSYRRLMQMFGKTVLGRRRRDLFEHALDEAKRAKGTTDDLDLDEDDIRGARRHLPEDRPRPHRPRLPAGPARADGPGRPAPSSTPGTATAPSSTAARSASRPTSVPP